MRRGPFACVLAAVVLGLLPQVASAARLQCFPPEPAATGARVVHETLSFRGSAYRFTVLLPPDYGRRPAARYPALYLLHGGEGQTADSWLRHTDLLAFTSRLPSEQQAVVVMPDNPGPAIYADWPDGTHLYETFHTQVLIPYIDAHFRTVAGGAHRAIAGLSSGALGAAAYAAKHPDLFTVVGGFSGVYSVGAPVSQPLVELLAVRNGLICTPGYSADDAFGPWGPLATQEVWWRNASPVELVTNLDGVAVHIAAGDGTLCDEADAAEFGDGFIEVLGPGELRRFDDAMNRAAVPHTADFYGCGIHTWRYWQRDLHTFWPLMLQAFGSPEPPSFDFRGADPTLTVWGWRFSTDRHRAAEFLSVVNASRRGVTLTGSGRTAVTTAPLFRSRQRVGLTGAVEPVAVADATGSITFQVDLGPPHRLQQYTPVARQLEAGGNYFRSRTVRFTP